MFILGKEISEKTTPATPKTLKPRRIAEKCGVGLM